jgi:ubiquinone/menaquinone biosynthesis C-methylase UbiE
VKAYYDRRAPEYDDWYEGRGGWAAAERPKWDAELRALEQTLTALAPATTLDVACGTGYLTRWLPGAVVGLDQSGRMLDVARERVSTARFVRGEGLALPFAEDSFERVFTAHFYGHLQADERDQFLAEARRVGRELVIVDASQEHSAVPDEWQERVLNDGSRWQVYKRYFTPETLLDELGGGETIHQGRWFVVVRSPRQST